jgi:selenocysteine lyase/cysteine desulfurase
MDLDFYVSGTLKYLLGPPGLAFMYVKKSLISSLVPTVTRWFGRANRFAFNVRLFDPAQAGRRFESGTPPIPSIYGACEGVHLRQEIGMPRVADQVKTLIKVLLDGVRELGIRAKTPPDSVGPLVVLQCTDADALVQKFAVHGVVLSSRHDGLRIAFHVYNTLDGVQFVLQLLATNLDLLVREPATTQH